MIARNETRATVLADPAEAATSFVGRFLGLMGRPSLAPGTGLWLAPGNGIHMFFMRFAIDAVFLGPVEADGHRMVVGVRRGLRPWTGLVPLVRGAAGVLELPVGAAVGTEPGDRVRLEG